MPNTLNINNLTYERRNGRSKHGRETDRSNSERILSKFQPRIYNTFHRTLVTFV